MKLSKLYKEAEEEKKNKPKDTKIEMEREEFIDEHKKLIKILREGSREELLAEADRQEEELEECIGEEEEED